MLEQGLCQTPQVSNQTSGRTHRSLRSTSGNPVNNGKRPAKELELGNKPIRQSLVPSLERDGLHPLLKERRISQTTCEYLGCGFLPKTKSPLSERIVFQIRGVEETTSGLKPTILGHIGRATNDSQCESHGKWLTYAGFQKRFELYNVDRLLTDPEAIAQVQLTGHVLIVEGPFDVAKCIEAGIRNVVATLGSDLLEDALPKFDLIQKYTNPKSYVVWFDRDEVGKQGQTAAVELLERAGYPSTGFDWEQSFGDQKIQIPEALADPCDMSCQQLSWLRRGNLI